MLERNGSLTGVIDWSDAAIGDPALDFARLYRDCGPSFLTTVLEAYGGTDDPDAVCGAGGPRLRPGPRPQ